LGLDGAGSSTFFSIYNYLEGTNMSQVNLVRFDGEDGIEILIDTVTGESFCSVKGYARMAGKSKSTISERLQGVRPTERQTAEISTTGGIQVVRLISEDLIVDWLITDNPAAAKALLKLGVRMALHTMAGYEVKSTAIETPVNEAQPRLMPHEIVLQVSDTIEAVTAKHEQKNPRLCQLMIDYAMRTIDPYGEQALKSSVSLPVVPQQKWGGVIEIAQDMGHTKIPSDSKLGRFVAKAWREAGRGKPHSDKRLCAGGMRSLCVYPFDSQLVRDAITRFFDLMSEAA
jgi:hypothetical protein